MHRNNDKIGKYNPHRYGNIKQQTHFIIYTDQPHRNTYSEYTL